jgi:hypothetical protein
VVAVAEELAGDSYSSWSDKNSRCAVLQLLKVTHLQQQELFHDYSIPQHAQPCAKVWQLSSAPLSPSLLCCCSGDC